MTDDRRWAARYAFLEDLWRDRPRVIVDARLEAALRARPRRRSSDDEPVDALVDALVPRVPKARTWVAVADEAVARELAQTRPGTGFLPRASFADVVAHREWAVALVELDSLVSDAPGGTRLRTQLAERAAEGRTVVVSARAQPQADEDLGFAALAELLEETLGGGRIYGMYSPPMAAVVDFGDDQGDADGEVPLAFDNTLGAESPAFESYVGVAGDAPSLPEGMTLVELPQGTPGASQGDDGLRTQLVQAQRQVELAAIDRQTLLEKVDALESAQATVEQQATELRDRLARAVTEAAPEASEAADRLQASLAESQALRWKVQQLERELMDAKARPVEELEAEVARLTAQLTGAHGAAEPSVVADSSPDTVDSTRPDGSEPPAAEAPTDAENETPPAEAPTDAATSTEALEPDDAIDDDDALGEIVVMVSEADDLAHRVRRGQTLRELDALIQRVERGGIGALPLRRALVSLRRRLSS